MRKGMRFLMVLWALHLFFASSGDAQDDVFYARCNLKVLEGNEITWINWQAAPTFIPVGTKLRVTRAGNKASLVNLETKTTYTLDIGADGQAFLEKFVTKKPVDIRGFPADVQTDPERCGQDRDDKGAGLHCHGAAHESGKIANEHDDLREYHGRRLVGLCPAAIWEEHWSRL